MANLDDLENAIYKLRYGRESDFSVSMKPQECVALLAVLPDKDIAQSHGLKMGGKGLATREWTRVDTGDPGDEQPA